MTGSEASRWWPVVRMALLVVLVADAAVAWVAAPTSADLGLLASAVERGRVAAIHAAPRSPTIGPVTLWSAPDTGVEWADRDGRRWLTRSGGGVDGLTRLLPEFQPGRGALPARNDLLGPVGSRDWLGALRDVLDLLAAAAWLFMLVLLVRGPRPRWATRWGWFWLFMAPLSIGGLYWLLREAPGAPRAPAPATRVSGWLGLLVAAASGAVGTWILAAVPALTPSARASILLMVMGVAGLVGVVSVRLTRARRAAPGV